MKVAIGVFVGIAVVVILGLASCAALVGGFASSVSEPTETSSGDHPTSESEEESPITFTAANAGTVTDFAGDTYTVVEITIQNDSESETVHVNAFDFSAELSDGSVQDLDTWSGDLTNPLDAVDVGPGQSATGQLSTQGNVDVAKVQWENNLLSNEKQTAEVE